MEVDEEEVKEKKQRLEVDCNSLADQIMQVATKSKRGCRKDLYSLVKTFRDMADGVAPQEDILSDAEDDDHAQIDEAVQRLAKFEKTMSTKKPLKSKDKGKAKKRKLPE